MRNNPSVIRFLVVVVAIALFGGGGHSQAFFLGHTSRRDRQVARHGRFLTTGSKRHGESISAFAKTTKSYKWRTSSSHGGISAISSTTAATADATALAVPRGSTVELMEPETGCHVILLGCFHGSQSSAADVTSCITNDTNVVCLELCASRFEDLRGDLLQDQQQAEASNNNMAPAIQKRKKLWIFRFAEMVQKKVQSRGLSTGVAAALLGGVSGMQTALSGLEPGLEFRRALERVQTISAVAVVSDSSRNDYDSNSIAHFCDIVLADQNVDETLQKVGQLPSLAVEMWKDCWQHGWESSCGIEASALKTALAGSNRNNNNNKLQQVTIWSFLTRNPAAVRDMGRLVLPPILLLNAVAWNAHESSFFDIAATTANDAAAMADFASMAASPLAQDAVMTIAAVTANWLFLFFLYVSVALPVARVVLRERDDTLAAGIRQACHLAREQQQQQRSMNELESSTALPPPPIRVVAVLGYLHVNGVAERLLRQRNDADVAVSPDI
jgi:hypothetical protein